MLLCELVGMTLDEWDKADFEEKYTRAIEYLGGLEAVRRYVPINDERAKNEFAVDPHFNETPLRVWDNAAGSLNGSILLKNISTTLSERVCILKNAARLIATEDELPDSAEIDEWLSKICCKAEER